MTPAPVLTITNTSLFYVDGQLYRIETYLNPVTKNHMLFSYAKYEVDSKIGESIQTWRILNYNREETADPAKAISEILEKIRTKALPDGHPAKK